MMTWTIRAHGDFARQVTDDSENLAAALAQVLDKPPRRINRYSQLALIGAHRCVAKLASPLPAHTSLYLASENGSIAETVSLMDTILFDRLPPKPMSFINSSSNMAGFYTAASLNLRGNNMTVSRHFGAFGAMLELADLDECRQDAMLLGLVSEAAWPLAEHRYRRGLRPETPLVESSYWLVVDASATDTVAKLDYATTRDPCLARRWLADGQYWAIDPQFSRSQHRLLRADLPAERAWPHVQGHRGHPDAIVAALFAGLNSRVIPGLRLVARDGGQTYQLLGLKPPQAQSS